MNWNVLSAIFKRNFVSYFANPTGYVFVCVFVLLSSFAAFWPTDFFNNNLADLEQLNKYLPYIMLVFIPAITMSIWADERRQGTDELLLTIPAGDLDVVLGKYLAAVAIYSVALVFSMVANLGVLLQLGVPDMGLFAGTYVGYWFVGIAMLSVGMVASFLTANLTVGFVLGALFNAPLAFSASAGVIIKDPRVAQSVERWSLASQFHDFQRGVLSLSSISYFVMIAVVMLYLSIVLIGRRHWMGGRDGRSMIGHYLVRTLALLALAIGVNLFFSGHDLRLDVTSERLSSLSPDTKKLIADLQTNQAVTIEAYISPHVPTEYVQTKLDLLSTLDELKALGSGKIRVIPHVIENYSEEAVDAEQKYDIKPQTVLSTERGARKQEEIFMGAAFTCGLDKVVLPFIDKGIPVEYELVRSIATVAQQKRKKLGVLKTDVSLFGGFSMQTMSPTQDSKLIEELKKQYDVEEVDPAHPITKRYDVLLAVQPSSLSPDQLDNFVDVVKRGQPTAIFEDPFPLPNFYPNVPGTGQPKRPPQMNPFMQRQPPQPKGDIGQLWDLLGVRLNGTQVVWQDYNPYPKGREFISPEWIFIDRGIDTESPFNDQDPITSGLQQVLFIFAGSWEKKNTSDLKFTELASTGTLTGTIGYSDIMRVTRPSPVGMSLQQFEVPTAQRYVLAARVRGEPPVEDELDKPEDDQDDGPDQDPKGDVGKPDDAQGGANKDAKSAKSRPDDSQPAKGDAAKKKGAPGKKDDRKINVVLVSDIDCLASAFFFVRAQGAEENADISWNFDNVTFVLNALDVLAGDQRFVEIRKRRRPHRTLVKVESRTEEARKEAAEQRQKFMSDFTAARDQEQKKFDKRIKEIEKSKGIDARDLGIRVEMARRDGQRRLDIRMAQLEQQRNRDIKKIERNLALEINRVQDRYKLLAVLIPPIPPLLVAFFVFFQRRQSEREGVAKSRLR